MTEGFTPPDIKFDADRRKAVPKAITVYHSARLGVWCCFVSSKQELTTAVREEAQTWVEDMMKTGRYYISSTSVLK